MTCPACGGELVAGADRCPVCDASIAPRVEGALAADPRLVTPPARVKPREPAAGAKEEPIREIPGLRRRDARDAKEQRSWRDEVQERVRSRRQKRAEAGLPLFEQEAVRPTETRPLASRTPEPTVEPPVVEEGAPPVPFAPPAVSAPAHVLGGEPEASERDTLSAKLSDAELDDLPLRGDAPLAHSAAFDLDSRGLREPEPRNPPSLDDDAFEDAQRERELELEPQPGEPPPLERPARAFERAQAAALDLALFAVIASVVLYFAGRAARVELLTLRSAWPWVLGFLALLATFYACYFTGTTGRTPGKLITGLHVVDASGRPPRYPRATGRAVVGLLGVALGGLGLLPMAFDPAGRALHDRLFRTRVVRR